MYEDNDPDLIGARLVRLYERSTESYHSTPGKDSVAIAGSAIDVEPLERARRMELAKLDIEIALLEEQIAHADAIGAEALTEEIRKSLADLRVVRARRTGIAPALSNIGGEVDR